MLNFVLVDFKGGATFAGLDRLPHISAVITNLAGRAAAGRPHAGRAITASWSAARSCCARPATSPPCATTSRPAPRGAPLAPLPQPAASSVDEFSELLAAKPEFIDLFVQIGRLGRSLGVHLLLASSGWRRAGCAGWRRTCPTGSGCAPSPRWRAAHGARRARRLRAAPLPGPRLPASPAPSRCCGSRPRTSPGRYRAARRGARPGGAGGPRACAPFSTSTACPGRGAGGRPPRHRDGRGRRGPAEPCSSVMVDRLAGAGAAGAPGVAAAAGRARRPSTSCSAGSASDPARGPDGRRPGAARRAAGAGRRSSTSRFEQRRDAARGSTWPAPAATSPSSAARRAASRRCCAR